MGSGASTSVAEAVSKSSGDELNALLQGMSESNWFELNGSSFAFKCAKPLEPERVAVYSTQFPDLVGADQVMAVMTEGDGCGGEKEFVAAVKGDSVSVVKGTCAITLVELLPSEAIEYSFSEDPGKWFLAQISMEALEMYKASKFDQWKEMLMKGQCEAQLRRMLQAGVIGGVYDEVVFPTPEEYRHLFKVKCAKTGRVVNIPHPVAELRIWNAAESKHVMLDPLLKGAPAEEDKETCWEEILKSLKELRGAEYIEELLANEPADDEPSASIADLKFEIDGSSFKYSSEKPMEPERQAIYTAQFADMAGADKVVAVITEGVGGAKEFTAVVKGESVSVVKGACAITLAEMLPSEGIEYSFSEDPDKWALAQISKDALEMYRTKKFDQWKDMLTKGECEAQLRRMLLAGVVSCVYDEHVFPTPEEYRHLFKVKCEKTGRMVNIPHPVAALRVWNAAESKYDTLDARLAGAPANADKDAVWGEILKTLKEARGADYIDELMSKEPADEA
eukprot:TRINITY_DN90781_c0_g1_i1.p1 TRINITY_DN90781_c0_g1~~TRINITY_DN90781_c0_g1_i1.p1  ORF type:complete len:522 (+),score=110.83 TRINITY_DN90781_c0_g1_i1:46-1566(+)